MTPEEQTKILEALRPKVKGPCPNCGSKAWTVGGLVLSPEMSLTTSEVIFGGAGIPMVSVVCNNCSLVHFYAAVPLGLVARAPQAPQEKP